MEHLKDIGDSPHATLFIVLVIGIVLIVSVLLIGSIRDKKLLETVTSANRGTKSERDLVLKLLKHGVPPQTIFHDLCIVKRNGKFSQIDLVLATTEGIIVFEVKDYSGWIYGNGHHTNWTKVLAYGKKKFRFYNPIKQNESHIKALRKQLKQFEEIPFYSIVAFYGDCVLKEINYVPSGTYLVKSHRILEVLRRIKNNNKPAPYTNKHEVVRVLKQAVENGRSTLRQEKHIENIKDMIGKDRIFD